MRVSAEEVRVSAEEVRVSAEEVRVSAEEGLLQHCSTMLRYLENGSRHFLIFFLLQVTNTGIINTAQKTTFVGKTSSLHTIKSRDS